MVGGRPRSAFAHSFTITNVVGLLKPEGTYQIDLTVDLDALALGVPDTTDSGNVAASIRSLSPVEFDELVEDLRDTLSRRVRIRFDGAKVEPMITFPQYGTPMAVESEIPTVLGTIARFEGRVPAGAKEFNFGASRAFNAVHLTIVDVASGVISRHVLGASEDSPPFSIGVPASEPRSAGFSVARQYLWLGFEHILPEGLDHILFVLGLFLLSARLRPLLWQVTAFTVAHSITLALSMYDVVSLPSRLVETLIALSIAYVAVENMVTSDLKPWRPVIVFLFGLLHGLGFAGVLRELGMPEGQFTLALLTFNVGVELGQLTVVGLAFFAVGWFRSASWHRQAVVLPLSAGIALIGLYWAVARAFGVA